MTFHQGANDRVAVIFPGANYSLDRPLLYYAQKVLLAEGWSVKEVWWEPGDLLSEEAVLRKAESALEKVADHSPLVVAKSIGTLVLPSVTERGWPAIWLTPLLNNSEIVNALKSVKNRALLVGGTADHFWDSEVARASGQRVLEMPGADHGLEISGDPLASVGLLREFVIAMTSFVQSL